jgi:hypothetical protein
MKLPTDAIPVPDVYESFSDSLWQEFLDSNIALENQFADTIPAPLDVKPTTPDYTPVISPEEDPFKPR